VIGDDLRLSFAFGLGCLNFISLCFFIYLFKTKVDKVTATQILNKYEDEEILISGQSIMIENIP